MGDMQRDRDVSQFLTPVKRPGTDGQNTVRDGNTFQFTSRFKRLFPYACNTGRNLNAL